MSPVPVPARFMCHCYPPNQPSSLEMDCICLVCFSTLRTIWTGLAVELKLEGINALFFVDKRFVFHIFSFSLSGVLFLFVGTVIFCN